MSRGRVPRCAVCTRRVHPHNPATLRHVDGKGVRYIHGGCVRRYAESGEVLR